MRYWGMRYGSSQGYAIKYFSCKKLYYEKRKINKIKQLRIRHLGEKVANSESGKVVQAKSFAFAMRVVELKQYLNQEKKEFTLSGQLQRSGTSIGANVREAYRGESDPDFVHKLGVSLKECNESQYWLELLFTTGLNPLKAVG